MLTRRQDREAEPRFIGATGGRGGYGGAPAQGGYGGGFGGGGMGGGASGGAGGRQIYVSNVCDILFPRFAKSLWSRFMVLTGSSFRTL